MKQNKAKQNTCFFCRTFKLIVRIKWNNQRNENLNQTNPSLLKKNKIEQYLSFGHQIQSLVSDAVTCLSLSSFVNKNDS